LPVALNDYYFDNSKPMTEIYGDFQEALPSSDQFLVISFSPSSIPLQQRWRNNGLSADFVADYLTTFFPASEDDPITVNRQTELKGAVSYIANELLENAMKFHDESSNSAIRFGIHLLNDTVVLFSSNCVAPDTLDKFRQVVQELTTSDLEELYVHHLEKMAEDENLSGSGLGLITIMQDYAAKLGWKVDISATEPQITTITTMVQVQV
jgi:hypothetical protein